MLFMQPELNIESRDYWFKVVEMLQQNWALVDPHPEGGVVAHFLGDTSGAFDQMEFPDQKTAERALSANGFRRFADDQEAADFLSPPSPPFEWRDHPNGRTYSSGRFWQS
ncbi:MAG: hypothetical protein KDC14_05385 [Planctomycetes bacterium]|nr:hypothetical protein [Planctomycetota bacterium]